MEHSKMINIHENGQCIYKGEYYNNEKHGEGQEFDEKGKSCYKGKYQNGLKNGQGTEYYNDGKRVKYMGNFNNGQYDGKGTYYEEDGTHYEGYFYLGKKHVMESYIIQIIHGKKMFILKMEKK